MFGFSTFLCLLETFNYFFKDNLSSHMEQLNANMIMMINDTFP